MRIILQLLLCLTISPCFAFCTENQNNYLDMPTNNKYIYPDSIIDLKIEVADYNFDEHQDYREQKLSDTTKWNYFIFTSSDNAYVVDTLLSNLDYTYFDFEKKVFFGQKITRMNSLNTQFDNYTYVNEKLTLVEQKLCTQPFENAERMDCTVYILENGVLVFKEFLMGAE